jgi:hypothetical protein
MKYIEENNSDEYFLDVWRSLYLTDLFPLYNLFKSKVISTI